MAIPLLLIWAEGGDLKPPPEPGPSAPILSSGEAIAFCLLGSVTVILLSFVQYGKLPRAAPDLKDPLYWLTLLVFNPLLALIAGLVCVYGRQPLTSYAALALGGGVPVFVQRVIEAFAPSPPPPSKPPVA